MQPENNETKVNSNSRFVDLINDAKRIAILPSKVAGVDAFSAACGVFHLLREAQKEVSLIYMGKIPETCEGLVKPEEVTSDIFERELLVSIDYSNTPAARVHYSTENDVLFLKVKPIDKNFDLSRVTSTIKGFDFDLVIALGAQSLEDFGQIYTELGAEFSQSVIINFDNTDKNTRFGYENVVDPLMDSISLVTMQKLVSLGYKLDVKSAKAFLTGVLHRNTN